MQNGTNITNSDESCSDVCDSIDTIFTFNNLYNAYEKCTLGVKWKWSTQNYMINACTRITRLYKRIQAGKYKSPPAREFYINERGKSRKITALGFEDRIVNKCLCDNYLNPLLSKSLIYDSGATIKNKGLSFTKRRVLCHLQRYFRKYGNDGYVLKLDLKHYFESINHDILIKKMSKKVHDTELLKFIKQLVDTNKDGLGLGSQVSQIGAMYYLNELDHLIKEKLHCKYYGRYMDDMYILDNDYKRLKYIKNVIREFLKADELTLNESKSNIYKLEDGFVFCKTRYKLTKSGKIKKLITTKTFRSMIKKIKKGIEVKNIFPAFLSYINDFNCYNKFNNFKRKVNYEIL